MGKFRKWFFQWFDSQIEKSFQRTANKIQKETDKIMIKNGAIYDKNENK